MTSFYSWRLFFLTFEGTARWAKRITHTRMAHEGVEHDATVTTSGRAPMPSMSTARSRRPHAP